MEEQVGMIQEKNKSRLRIEYGEQKNHQTGGKTDELYLGQRLPFMSWHIPDDNSNKQATKEETDPTAFPG